MVEGQKEHAASLKQKTCLYFMSKHTMSVRPPTIATNTERMNQGEKK